MARILLFVVVLMLTAGCGDSLRGTKLLGHEVLHCLYGAHHDGVATHNLDGEPIRLTIYISSREQLDEACGTDDEVCAWYIMHGECDVYAPPFWWIDTDNVEKPWLP